jgi:pyruvate/2-oxoglutarate dehydrogenase complex dihydrolipoamide dehydrogenase (E3) component
MSLPSDTLPDRYDRVWEDHVRPADWRNPNPEGPYNLVVVGAGAAGLISASLAAGLGARVALVERGRLGGDCLNAGCVPSKALLRAARMVHEARRAASELGLPLGKDAQADFGRVMERLRRVRATIAAEDAALRYRDELGVDVYLGEARFASPDTVEIGGDRLLFRRAVVATGGRPMGLPTPGLEEAGFLTNETLFDLRRRPTRLAIVGAGPIGCEMAQAFTRLGTSVVVIHADQRPLPREDADAAAIIEERLRSEGVDFVHGVRLRRVELGPGGKVLHTEPAEGGEAEAETRPIEVDEILVAVGRTPNVRGLGLEAAGVEFDERRGVVVDDGLQTTNPRIFAAGDVCMPWQFTHAADAAAKIVVQNALFSVGSLGRKKLSDLVLPWCTFTDPEVAHVGLGEASAAATGMAIDTYAVPMREVNRAVTDGEEDGFVKIHTRRGTDEIVGATVVAAHAGEMINEITLAMVESIGLGRFVDVIHPYPVGAEAIRRAAGLHARGRLTPVVKTVFDRYLGWRRG